MKRSIKSWREAGGNTELGFDAYWMRESGEGNEVIDAEGDLLCVAKDDSTAQWIIDVLNEWYEENGQEATTWTGWLKEENER